MYEIRDDPPARRLMMTPPTRPRSLPGIHLHNVRGVEPFGEVTGKIAGGVAALASG